MRRDKIELIIFDNKDPLWPGREHFLKADIIESVTVHLREDWINNINLFSLVNSFLNICVLRGLMSVAGGPLIHSVGFTDVNEDNVDLLFESLVHLSYKSQGARLEWGSAERSS